MSIFERFFGKDKSEEGEGMSAAPDGAAEDGAAALQLLFAGELQFDPQAITRAMRAYHPSMANAHCEIAPELNEQGHVFGLAGWDKHVIRLFGMNFPDASRAR